MAENNPDLLPFFDALGDGVYTVDPNGTCLFINAAALRILGFEDPDELLGRNMHDVIHHTRIDGSPYPRCECPLLHTAQGGSPVRLDNELLWRRDGSSFLAEYSAFPAHREGRAIGSIITFSESQVRHDARIRLSVQHALGIVLTAPLGRDAMMEQAHRTIAGGFGWQAGLFWCHDGGSQDLRLAAQWQAVASLGQTSADCSIGLAAQAFASQQAVKWSHDVPINGDQVGAVADQGMRSGFAFPVVAGSSVFGALEFQRIRFTL